MAVVVVAVGWPCLSCGKKSCGDAARSDEVSAGHRRPGLELDRGSLAGRDPASRTYLASSRTTTAFAPVATGPVALR